MIFPAGDLQPSAAPRLIASAPAPLEHCSHPLNRRRELCSILSCCARASAC
jgi:hypothetical protein